MLLIGGVIRLVMIVLVMNIRQVRMFMQEFFVHVNMAVFTVKTVRMRVVVVPIYVAVAVVVCELRVKMAVCVVL